MQITKGQYIDINDIPPPEPAQKRLDYQYRKIMRSNAYCNVCSRDLVKDVDRVFSIYSKKGSRAIICESCFKEMMKTYYADDEVWND